MISFYSYKHTTEGGRFHQVLLGLGTRRECFSCFQNWRWCSMWQQATPTISKHWTLCHRCKSIDLVDMTTSLSSERRPSLWVSSAPSHESFTRHVDPWFAVDPCRPHKRRIDKDSTFVALWSVLWLDSTLTLGAFQSRRLVTIVFLVSFCKQADWLSS